MSYSVGNWTIDLPVTDTVSTAKTLSIPDLSYAADYSAGGAATLQADHRETLVNTTGTMVMASESLEYALKKLMNVYGGLNIPTIYQGAVKSGRKGVIKSSLRLTAVNSVSGEEIIIPIDIHTVIKIPDNNILTPTILVDMVKRHVAALLPTGAVTGNLLANLMRGDVNPAA